VAAGRCTGTGGRAEQNECERDDGRRRANDPSLPLEHIPDPDEGGGCGTDDGEEDEVIRELVQPHHVGQECAGREGHRKQPRSHLLKGSLPRRMVLPRYARGT